MSRTFRFEKHQNLTKLPHFRLWSSIEKQMWKYCSLAFIWVNGTIWQYCWRGFIILYVESRQLVPSHKLWKVFFHSYHVDSIGHDWNGKDFIHRLKKIELHTKINSNHVESTTREVSFEWLHQRISNTYSQVRTTSYQINSTMWKYY